jgi:hypothetical protein
MSFKEFYLTWKKSVENRQNIIQALKFCLDFKDSCDKNFANAYRFFLNIFCIKCHQNLSINLENGVAINLYFEENLISCSLSLVSERKDFLSLSVFIEPNDFDWVYRLSPSLLIFHWANHLPPSPSIFSAFTFWMSLSIIIEPIDFLSLSVFAEFMDCLRAHFFLNL